MKKIIHFLFITMSMLMSVNLYSQIEFAPIGAKWYVNDDWCSGFEQYQLDSFEMIECTGDTMIDDKLCKIVRDQLFYQDVNKIYYLDSDTFRLIFDFGVAVGDTVMFDLETCYEDIDSKTFVIDSINIVNIGGFDLKKISTTTIFSLFTYSYIYYEKFGTFGTLTENEFCDIIIPEHHPKFLRCYEDQDIFFKTPKYLDYGDLDCEYLEPISSTSERQEKLLVEIFPNPIMKVMNLEIPVQANFKDLKFQLYRTTGEEVFSRNIFQMKTQLNVEGLITGIYFYTIKSKRNVLASGKIVKN